MMYVNNHEGGHGNGKPWRCSSSNWAPITPWGAIRVPSVTRIPGNKKIDGKTNGPEGRDHLRIVIICNRNFPYYLSRSPLPP